MARIGRSFPVHPRYGRPPVLPAAAYVLAADAGSFALTGTAATLKHGYAVAAGAGSYALSGTAASPLHQWKVAAGVGSYVLTGTAASLLHQWKVVAGAGSYALTGAAATLRTKPAFGGRRWFVFAQWNGCVASPCVETDGRQRLLSAHGHGCGDFGRRQQGVGGGRRELQPHRNCGLSPSRLEGHSRGWFVCPDGDCGLAPAGTQDQRRGRQL
jgi:hypothetical protein